MKSLSRLISNDRIVSLSASDKEGALKEMVGVIAKSAELSDSDKIHEAILEREGLLSTGFGLGLAIPHAKLDGVKDFVVGLGLHVEGLEYESLDDKPVHILTMIIGPNSRQEEYLRVLARVTAFLKENREKLLECETPDEIYELTLEY